MYRISNQNALDQWCLYSKDSKEPLAHFHSKEFAEKVLEALNSTNEDVRFLEALRQAGVDNWEGYSFALEILREQKA